MKIEQKSETLIPVTCFPDISKILPQEFTLFYLSTESLKSTETNQK